MKKTRRTEKTVEIHEFYAVRTASGSLPALCGDCATGDAIMLPPEQAAVLAHLPVRAVYRWIEANLVHYQEATNGSVIICIRSLVAAENRLKEIRSDQDKSGLSVNPINDLELKET